MPAYRVTAPFTDHTTGAVVPAGRPLPRHLADDPAVVARLTAARCLEPAQVAGDTPALPAIEAGPPVLSAIEAAPPQRRPVRGRKRAKG